MMTNRLDLTDADALLLAAIPQTPQTDEAVQRMIDAADIALWDLGL